MPRTFTFLAAATFLALPLFAEDAAKKKEKRISPAFEDALLADVLDYLTKEGGFEFTLSTAAQKVARKGLVTVRLVAKDVTPREALDMLLASLDLASTEKVAGQVRILSAEEYARDVVLELHDVRELLAAIVDFEGPELEGFETDEGGEDSGPRRGVHFEDPEEGEAEKERPLKPIEDPEKLPGLVRDGTGGDKAWVEGTAITLQNGILYVKAPHALQAKVRGFLKKLMQYK